ncbi:MAG: DUF3108 domain-containing protein [Aliidiomarina sp.]|uniref:DUF3108 domain-containing protein n=1 Tax=Aliidiomarina sp. TaxID=1872439 RepID=UPI0025B9F256|nr:DUF3108 domain-containing protein [Aliidiomarina sp.]MCH8500543.1 DUF3108 domain-containing protein [Aliidiomarina sp.]
MDQFKVRHGIVRSVIAVVIALLLLALSMLMVVYADEQGDEQPQMKADTEVEYVADEGADADQSAEQQAKTIAHAITRAYRAEYDLSRRGRTHGTALRELKHNDDGLWQYHTNTEASLLFLSDRRYNDSTFQLIGAQVQPLHYVYERRGTGSNRFYEVTFERESETLRAETGDTVHAEWRDDLLDANTVLHQLQIDVAIGAEESFEYFLIDEDGRDTSYMFAIDKREQITVMGERREAIRVSRVRDHDRRQTYFWFAPELNYTMVRMQQIEGGKEQAQVNVTQLIFANDN